MIYRNYYQYYFPLIDTPFILFCLGSSSFWWKYISNLYIWQLVGEVLFSWCHFAIDTSYLLSLFFELFLSSYLQPCVII